MPTTYLSMLFFLFVPHPSLIPSYAPGTNLVFNFQKRLRYRSALYTPTVYPVKKVPALITFKRRVPDCRTPVRVNPASCLVVPWINTISSVNVNYQTELKDQTIKKKTQFRWLRTQIFDLICFNWTFRNSEKYIIF